MVEVRIPKEIRDYEDKLVAGLTVRQVITTVIAGVISAIMYFKLKDIVGTEILSNVIMVIDCIILAVGWIEYNGMKMEKFALLFIEQNFFQQKRYYEELDINSYFIEEIKKENRIEENLSVERGGKFGLKNKKQK